MVRFPNGTAELRPDRVDLPDVTLRFVGAASTARLEGLGPAAPSTYLRAGFVRTLRQYPRLAVHGLYPGVDAIFYGNGENLEYDLQFTSAASLNRVRIAIEGTHEFVIDDLGNLTIRTAAGVLRQMRPHVYQRGREISASYVRRGASEVGIRLGKHVRRAPLTVDPVLTYTKTFGGSGSNPNLAATDAQGNIYVAGQTNGVDFPTTSGSFDPTPLSTLRVLSNAGQTIDSHRPGTALSVGTVGATPDGQILYAGTPQGILLSGDSGVTWRQTAPLPLPGPADFPRSVSISAFAIDSLDPATILVATSSGLFGTDSAGQFWGERNTGLNVSASGVVFVASVFYHPLNPLLAYAVTSAPSYLFASSDAGNTWRRLEPTYPGEPSAPAFSFSPNLAATITPDGSLLYAINGNGTLLESPDGGNSWIKLAQGFSIPVSIQVDPSQSSTIYVLDARGLHKSTDGGATFADVPAPIIARTLAVDSAGSVYLSGLSPVIYLSLDGGKSFAAVPNLTSLTGPTLSASGNKVYAGYFSPSIPFVIKLDPTGQNILYSTFLGGGSGDLINGLTVDSQGNAVLAGIMFSPDFPLTVPASSPPSPGKSDGFVTKLSADGTGLIYSMAVAASKSVSIQAVALDSAGAVFVTGQAEGNDFPTTPNAFQPAPPLTPCTRPSGSIFGPRILLGNAFVSKISADGKSAVYTTFLSGSCGSRSSSISTDAAGAAIVAGFTTSPDFPVSAGSYQAKFPGPVDQTGPGGILNAGFVTKISPAGDKLVASTFLGGGYATQANSVVLDPSGNAYITGFTQGFAPGATPGAYQTKLVDACIPTLSIGPSAPYTGTGDAFVLKLDPTLSTAGFLTYLGGGCNDSGSHIGLDQAGNIWLSGTTTSPDFPLKDPFQASGIPSAPNAGFVSELSRDGAQLLFSSFSQAVALAVTPASVYLAGSTSVSAFVTAIDPVKTPAISIDSIGPVVAFPSPTIVPFSAVAAPGQLIQIKGRNLGPANKLSAQVDASGRLPFVLGNTLVFFDNVPAPLLSVEASSIMCFVPFEAGSIPKVTVSSSGQVSNGAQIGVVASSPQVLSILNQDGSVNSADHPAKAGSVITLYVTGLGQTDPPGADGLRNGAPLPAPLVAVTVYFPTTPSSAVTPEFVAAAAGMIAGITQVDVRVPASIPLSGPTNPVSIGVNVAGAKLYTAQ